LSDEEQRRDQNLRRTWTGLYVPDSYKEAPEPNVSPLDVDEFEKQVDGLAFFEANPQIRCIWEFDTSEGPLQGLSFPAGETRIAGTDYWIVCPFEPGKLVIHSPAVLRAGRFHYQLSHGVLFDSNLYDRIVRFVNAPKDLATHEAQEIRRLLEALVVRKYDYQLMPYIIESLAKNGPELGYEYARRGVRAILALHMMDKAYFLATGSLREEPEALPYYEAEFGTTDRDRIVEAQLEPYIARPQTPLEVTVSLCAIIEMVLIRRCKMPTRTFDAQWAAFDAFMFDRFGFFAGRLRTVAIFYFAGRLDRWIRTQKDSRPDRALDALANCAWDLFLGNLPEQILAHSPETEPRLSHFCTREAELASLLSVYLIKAIRVASDGGVLPYLSTSEDLLHSVIGADSSRSTTLADQRARSFLDARDAGTVKRCEPQDLEMLLEEQKQRFLTAIGPSRPAR
jgi:hypothetical protein